MKRTSNDTKPRRMFNGRPGEVNSYFSRIVAPRLRKRDRLLAAMHDGTLSTSFALLSKKAREAFERQCRLIRLLAQCRFSKRCEESTSRLLLLTDLPLPVTSGAQRWTSPDRAYPILRGDGSLLGFSTTGQSVESSSLKKEHVTTFSSSQEECMFKKKQMDGDRWAVVLVSFDGKEEYFLTVFDYEEGANVIVKRLNRLAESWEF